VPHAEGACFCRYKISEAGDSVEFDGIELSKESPFGEIERAPWLLAFRSA
jgi:hypothetical protein